jgi:hypothetical protein
MEYIGLTATCNSFTTEQYTRSSTATRRQSKAQASCHKPYFCLKCAKSHSSRRAKKWTRKIESNPALLHFVTLTAPPEYDITDSERFLSEATQYIGDHSEGAITNLHIGKQSNHLHVHSVAVNFEKSQINEATCQGWNWQSNIQEVYDLQGALEYTLKYPITDYCRERDPVITAEYIGIANVFLSMKPTRKTGCLASNYVELLSGNDKR